MSLSGGYYVCVRLQVCLMCECPALVVGVCCLKTYWQCLFLQDKSQNKSDFKHVYVLQVHVRV